MASLDVLAPVAGRVVDLDVVPDVVFAGHIVGPGAAIQPAGSPVRVCAPIAGRVAVIDPQAIVISADAGRAVLVHLGIDTARLGGTGFTVHVVKDQDVVAGDLLVDWDPDVAVAAHAQLDVELPGFPVAGSSSLVSTVCPVIALQAPDDAVRLRAASGTLVGVGEELFTWACGSEQATKSTA